MASPLARLDINGWGDRFYSTALGRPSACNERDIRTPLPAIIPEVEYRNFQGSWPSQPENDTPISYSITNFRHTCNMLRLTAGPLDDMCVSHSALPEPEV